MQIRLTTPEAFDRLIDYLEKERDLVWPIIDKDRNKYRNWFIAKAKKLMETDTVLLDVEWRYNGQTNRVESEAHFMDLSEIATDEEYLEESKTDEKDDTKTD